MRVEGRVERIPAEESDAYWATRPAASRRSAAASRQSQPIDSRAELEAAVAAQPDEPPRPPRWGGYRLTPETYEFWLPPRRPPARTSPVQATRRRLAGATPATVKLLAAATVAVAAAAASGAAPAPQLGGCPVFPATSVWNAPVDTLPVAADSATIIASIG